jgi:DNA invertase Pin-like site-specific DNA recombinase
LKVAIYARVSTKDQSEAEQIPSIKKGFDLSDDVLVFREEVSAWSIDKEEKRFELKRLVSAIKAGSLDKLYIWDLDRLYRNRKKTREFFELCSFYNVEIFSLNQKWLNDFQKLKDQFPDNFKFLIENISSLLLDVYSQTAEDESLKKSERVRLKVQKCPDGVTRSVNGKKWGRRSLSPRIIKEVLQFNSEGRSIRWIASNTYSYDKNQNKKNLSVGAVHKIITENKGGLNR